MRVVTRGSIEQLMMMTTTTTILSAERVRSAVCVWLVGGGLRAVEVMKGKAVERERLCVHNHPPHQRQRGAGEDKDGGSESRDSFISTTTSHTGHGGKGKNTHLAPQYQTSLPEISLSIHSLSLSPHKSSLSLQLQSLEQNELRFYWDSSIPNQFGNKTITSFAPSKIY